MKSGWNLINKLWSKRGSENSSVDDEIDSSDVDFQLTAIPEAFVEVDDLPRPQWNRIKPNIAQLFPVPAQARIAFGKACGQWLAVLQTRFGEYYTVDSGGSFVILSRLSESQARDLLLFSTNALKSILKQLPGVAHDNVPGPHVLLLLEQKHYYTYVSHFDPEGELPTSGGMRIRKDYPHIVVLHHPRGTYERTVVHELTHACLDHLNLPRWLEEGITQTMEDRICGSTRGVPDRRQYHLYRRYWQRYGLQLFWTGKSFKTRGGQGPSYHLAKSLLTVLMAEHPRKIMEFISIANSNDAGHVAAKKVFGHGLEKEASRILGEGEWSPKNAKSATTISSNRLTY